MTPSEENLKKTIGVIILSFLAIPGLLMTWSFVRSNLQEKRLENEIANIFINHETELKEWASLLPEAIKGDDGELRSQILLQDLPAICAWIVSDVGATEDFSTNEYSMDCEIVFEQNEDEFLLIGDPSGSIEEDQIEFINALEFEAKQMPVAIDTEDANHRKYEVYVEISAEPWIIISFHVQAKDQ